MDRVNDKKETSPGVIVNFADAFLTSAVENPINGVGQLFGLPQLHLVGDYDKSSMAAKAGSTAGAVVDLIALDKTAEAGLGAVGLSNLTRSAVGSAAEMGTVGAIYGGVLTPSFGNTADIGQRLRTAAIDGVTFGILGGAAKTIQNRAEFADAADIPASKQSLSYNGLSKVNFLANSASNALSFGTEQMFQTRKILFQSRTVRIQPTFEALARVATRTPSLPTVPNAFRSEPLAYGANSADATTSTAINNSTAGAYNPFLKKPG